MKDVRFEMRLDEEGGGDLETLMKATGKSRAAVIRDLLTTAKAALDDVEARQNEINAEREALGVERSGLLDELGKAAARKGSTAKIHQRLLEIHQKDTELQLAKAVIDAQFGDAITEAQQAEGQAALEDYKQLAGETNEAAMQIVRALEALSAARAEYIGKDRELNKLYAKISRAGLSTADVGLESMLAPNIEEIGKFLQRTASNIAMQSRSMFSGRVFHAGAFTIAQKINEEL